MFKCVHIVRVGRKIRFWDLFCTQYVIIVHLSIDNSHLILWSLRAYVVMVYENSCRNWRFIRYFRFFVENFLPAKGSFQGFRIWRVGYYDAAWYMASVQGLKSCLWVHIWALIPQLNTDFFPVYLKDFQRKVSIYPWGFRLLFILWMWYAIWHWRVVRITIILGISLLRSVGLFVQFFNIISCICSRISYWVIFLLVLVEYLYDGRLPSEFFTHYKKLIDVGHYSITDESMEDGLLYWSWI